MKVVFYLFLISITLSSCNKAELVYGDIDFGTSKVNLFSKRTKKHINLMVPLDENNKFLKDTLEVRCKGKLIYREAIFIKQEFVDQNFYGSILYPYKGTEKLDFKLIISGEEFSFTFKKKYSLIYLDVSREGKWSVWLSCISRNLIIM